MAHEEDLIKILSDKFPFLNGHIRLQRPRRIFAEVDHGHFREVFDYAAGLLAFTMLPAISGLDEGSHLGVVYHLAREDGIVFSLKTSVVKEGATIQTVTRRFPGAEIYERELIDLFGMKVDGLPEGKRYPLPDDWPAGEYPLLKDWKQKSVEHTGETPDA